MWWRRSRWVFIWKKCKSPGRPRSTLLGIIQRGLVCALRHAQRQRRNRDAAAIEHAHRIDETVAFLPQQILRRNHAIFKDHFRRVASPQPELVLFLAGAKSLGISV